MDLSYEDWKDQVLQSIAELIDDVDITSVIGDSSENHPRLLVLYEHDTGVSDAAHEMIDRALDEDEEDDEEDDVEIMDEDSSEDDEDDDMDVDRDEEE